jgi:hypothetical protein
MNLQDALICAHALRLDADWDESAHPRAENGQFGSGEHVIAARDAIGQAHEQIGGATHIEFHRRSEGDKHTLDVHLYSANQKIGTVRELKGPTDPHKLIKEMKDELKAERAARKGADNHSSTTGPRTRDRTAGGFR